MTKPTGQSASHDRIRASGIGEWLQVAIWVGAVNLLAAWQRWVERRQDRKYCFHHDTYVLHNQLAQSWIKSELIDLGRRKRFWCEQCGKVWIV